MKTNVLLTGAGGNLAHFIHQALLASPLPVRVVGCNYNASGAGNYLTDVCYVVPPASDPSYVPAIIDLCKSEKIAIVMAGGMAEQRVLAEYRSAIKEQSGAFVVTSPPDVLRKMEDKWELSQHLSRAGFDAPTSVLPQDREQLARFLASVPYPYIIKDRFGAGSREIGVVHTTGDLEHYVRRIPNPVLQEYLYPDDEEYTVGVFLGADGQSVGSIVVKRTLGLGMTSTGHVLPDSPLGAYCERVMSGTGCLGPVNVQLRLTARGPVVFEVNTRFSSTTSARPHYGYNEAEMCIRAFVFNEKPARPVIRPGRFFRMVSDVFVSETEFETLRGTKRIENKPPKPE